MKVLYQCEICNKKEIFPFNFMGEKICNNCNKQYIFLRNICPICNKVLYKKYEGFVCKNHNCVIGGFKLGRGWVHMNKEKEDSELFFTSKYDFDIDRFKNNKKWLELKSNILYERGKCEICSSDRSLNVHHIMPKSSHPELTMDKENLMVLCEECHKQIHKGDKYKFS